MSCKQIASLLVLSNTLLCISIYCVCAAGRVLPVGRKGVEHIGAGLFESSQKHKCVDASLQANCDVACAEKACCGPVNMCNQLWSSQHVQSIVVQATARQPVQTYNNTSPFVSGNLAWHLLTRLHVAGHQCLEACKVEAGHTCHLHAVLQHHLLHASYALLTWEDLFVSQFKAQACGTTDSCHED